MKPSFVKLPDPAPPDPPLRNRGTEAKRGGPGSNKTHPRIHDEGRADAPEQVKAIASRHSNFQPGRSAGSGGGGEVPRGGMHGPMGTSHRRPFPAFFVGGEG